MLEHLRFCGWDIACIALMICLTVAFLLLSRKNKNTQRQLKEKVIASSLKDSIDEGRI